MITELLAEAALAAGVGVVGALVLRILLVELTPALTILLSGLAGVLVLALTSIGSLLFSRANSPIYIVGLAVVLCLGFAAVETRRSTIGLGLSIVAGAGLVTGVVTLALGLVVAPILTYDSWRFLEHGSSLFGDGRSIQFLLERPLGIYPIAITSLEGLAVHLGLPFFSSGLAAYGLLSVTAAFDAMSRPMTGPRHAARVLGILLVAVSVAASAYLTRLQLGYVSSHAMAAGWYALGAAAIFADGESMSVGPASSEKVRAAVLGIACCGLALTRVEGLLVCSLLLVVAVSHRTWTRRGLALLAGVGLLIPTIWYVRLLLSLVEADIFSPPRLMVMFALAAGPIAVSALAPSPRPQRWMAVAAISALALGAVALLFYNPSGVATSMTSLLLNLATRGLWGAIWWVLIPLAVLSLVRLGRTEPIAGWTVLTFGYVLLILLLGGIRDFAYFPRWGDSGNRMLVHVLPAFVLLVFYAFTGRTGGGEASEESFGEVERAVSVA